MRFQKSIIKRLKPFQTYMLQIAFYTILSLFKVDILLPKCTAGSMLLKALSFTRIEDFFKKHYIT